MTNIELKPCPKCGSTSVKYFEYLDDKYNVFCKHCGFETYYLQATKEQAAEVWNALPRHQQWTNATPTEPGWYWNRVAGKETIPVRLYYDSDGEFCYQVAGLPDDCWLVEDLADEVGCEWAGPVPEPQEPQR